MSAPVSRRVPGSLAGAESYLPGVSVGGGRLTPPPLPPPRNGRVWSGGCVWGFTGDLSFLEYFFSVIFFYFYTRVFRRRVKVVRLGNGTVIAGCSSLVKDTIRDHSCSTSTLLLQLTRVDGSDGLTLLG